MGTTLEKAAPETDGLQELFADIRERDAVIERIANGQMVPTDHILARKHGLTIDSAKYEWRERVNGVRYRSGLAGTPSQYAAALQRVEDAETAAVDAEKRLAPKIEAARQKLRELEQELKSFADEQVKARSAVKTMDESRDLLRGRLLPETLRSMQGPIAKAAMSPYTYDLKRLRKELTKVGGDSTLEKELKRQIADVEARIKAATPTTLVDVYIPEDPEE